LTSLVASRELLATTIARAETPSKLLDIWRKSLRGQQLPYARDGRHGLPRTARRDRSADGKGDTTSAAAEAPEHESSVRAVVAADRGRVVVRLADVGDVRVVVVVDVRVRAPAVAGRLSRGSPRVADQKARAGTAAAAEKAERAERAAAVTEDDHVATTASVVVVVAVGTQR